MKAFATPEEFNLRYPDDKPGERLEELLLDASAFLAGYIRRDGGVRIVPEDEIQARNLVTVTCAIVHRQVSVDVERNGLTQFSMTAGNYTESGTISNPSQDMYLTSTEKRLLGLSGRGRAGSLFAIRPKIGGCRDDG